MKIIAMTDHLTLEGAQNVLKIDNTADPRLLDLGGVQRIDLAFPKFTDGRAYSQAFLLRRRLGFQGEIRATGDVLIDQLVQMQRAGFDSAVLREGVDATDAQRQFERFSAFYQGDAVTTEPRFARASQGGAASLPPGRGAQTGRAIELNAKPSLAFAERLEEAIATLAYAAATGAVTQANSLGAEDMVITHLINANQLPISVFVLETGALHAETRALLDRLQAQQAAHPHAPLHIYRPQAEAVVQFVDREGTEAMYKSIELRKTCCGIRKMEPLGRALSGKQGWVTGLRREQSGARAEVLLVDASERASRDLLKFNPLASWSWGDVWHYIQTRNVAYNPLHDEFYPSIGCAPCTRAISAGEDFRAGRWWWEGEAAKECGLHVKQQQEGAPV